MVPVEVPSLVVEPGVVVDAAVGLTVGGRKRADGKAARAGDVIGKAVVVVVVVAGVVVGAAVCFGVKVAT